MFRTAASAVLSAAAVAVFVSCGGGGSSTSSTPNAGATLVTAATKIAAASDKTADAQTKAAAKTVAAVPTPSNQAQIGDLFLVLNGVNPQYVDDLFPAESGTHYVAVDITAKNTGSKTYDVNPLNFHLKDSEKFTTDMALTDGPKPMIGAVSMVPGQEIRGYIVFKVGDGRTPVELQYQSFTGSAGTIEIH